MLVLQVALPPAIPQPTVRVCLTLCKSPMAKGAFVQHPLQGQARTGSKDGEICDQATTSHSHLVVAQHKFTHHCSHSVASQWMH